MFRALLVLLVPLALSAPGGPPAPPVPSNIVLDPEVNDTLEEFEERFHLPEITDPKEHAMREKTLMEHEEQVKTVNKDFLAGRKSWYDAINEFSDLPVEEFEQEKTGAKMPESRYGRGLLTPTGKGEAWQLRELHGGTKSSAQSPSGWMLSPRSTSPCSAPP